MRNEKLLIIEKSLVTRRQIKNIFKNESNLEFIEANTFKKAIDALETENSNLLLVVLGIKSDQVEINGSLEVISEFLLNRIDKALSFLPIILLVDSRYLYIAEYFKDKKLAEKIIENIDYPTILIRPFTDEEFVTAIKFALPDNNFTLA